MSYSYKCFAFPEMVWVVGLFLMWYGFIVCWIFPIYYRSLRSRVLMEQSLWVEVLNSVYLLSILKRFFENFTNIIVKFFNLLNIIKFFKNFPIVVIKNNKLISQKRFYLVSYGMFCGYKTKAKVPIVTFDFVKNSSAKFREFLNGAIFGTNHPTNVSVLKVDNSEERLLATCNITHGKKNAFLFADAGELDLIDKHKQYFYYETKYLQLIDSNGNPNIENIDKAILAFSNDDTKIVEPLSADLKENEELLGSLLVFTENEFYSKYKKTFQVLTSDDMVGSLESLKSPSNYNNFVTSEDRRSFMINTINIDVSGLDD